MLARLLSAALLVAAVQAQVEDPGGDVLTAHDDHGHISAVYNEFDGRAHSLQVVRLTSQGDTVWNVLHSVGAYEKAYAAAMDEKAELFIAGVRSTDDQKHFLTLKYDASGALAWENVEDAHDCTATAIAVDRDDDVVVGGVCRIGDTFPALVVKYGNDGRELWSQAYDQDGHNYMRGLQIDYSGNVSLTVETVFGAFRDGSYALRTVVYSPDGQQLDVR